jgi:flagellar protein FlaE/flagellar protein FlaC
LCRRVGPASSDALDTPAYYEDVDWLADPVENQLRDYLTGFRDDGGVETEPDTTAELPVGAHRTRLRYVARLARLPDDR